MILIKYKVGHKILSKIIKLYKVRFDFIDNV